MEVKSAAGSIAGISGILRDRALRTPARRAYTFLLHGEEEGESLTYGELDRRARAIGERLARSRLGGRRALLLYPPGLVFVAAFFGCLYAGTVAVPAYPPQSPRGLPRLLSIVGDARPAAVLTTEALARKLAETAREAPRLARLECIATDDLGAGGEPAWEPPRADAEALAFLQYTSGSTAAPKGVMVSHGNLLHHEEMIRRAFAQSEASVVVGWLPLYHDMGLIGNVLQPLYVGAPCILFSPVDFLTRPRRWLAAISRYRATTSGGPNFAYDLCVRKIGPAEREGLDLASWRVAFNGAEPIRARTLDDFAAAFGPSGFRRAAFYPCYGLAEATLFASGGAAGTAPRVAAFDAAELGRGRIAPRADGRPHVSCGRPWMGQEIAIVDPEARRRRPPGAVGEIWIAGESVAQGYWDRPEASESELRARLADDPAAGPYLRTGDLGFLDGGELFVAGRLKDLIILRGRNLYPQDVEQAAERSHPALRPGCGAAFAVERAVESAVERAVERGGERGEEERLVVAWELDPHAEPDVEAVAGAVRQAVAEAVEAAVDEVVLLRAGSIPKTSSGKIRRGACREGYLAASLAVVGRSAAVLPEAGPAGEEAPDRRLLAGLPPDERLAALAPWLSREVARALRLPAGAVPPEEPLIRLGVDSLGAAELKQSLESRLGREVALADLLGGIGWGELARRLLAPESAAAAPEGGLAPRAAGEEAPASFGQRALWFLDRLLAASGPFHIAAAARVAPREPGAPGLRPAALGRALRALVLRHPALRTTFAARGGEPFQRIHAELPADFLAEDATGWSAAELAARLEREAYRPFDLAAGPLLRLAVFRTGPAEHVLLLAVHHIVADFWTVARLVRELAALYEGRELPPPPLTYADYALWQAERLGGVHGERLWDWWRERLAPRPPALALPADRPGAGDAERRGGAVAARLGAETSQRLAGLARAAGATPFAALLAVFQALLGRWSGQEDFLVGAPAAGRVRPELAQVAGYFANLLPLRADLAGDPSFATLVDRARRTAVEALEHQEMPFVLLAERLERERDAGESALLQAILVLQTAAGGEGEELAPFAVGAAGARAPFAGLTLAAEPLPERFSQFDLALRAAYLDGELVTSLQYSAARFDAATAERLVGHLRELARGAADDAERPLSALPLLTAAERRELVEAWSGAGAEPVEALAIHALFARRAAERPDAPALAPASEHGGRRLTYGELDAATNRLARFLRRLGVGLETRVALCLERSVELVVASLAVLKAGGAYVPLDPALPPERLGALLADCGAPVALAAGPLDLSAEGVGDGLRIVRLDQVEEAVRAESAAPVEPVAGPENLAYVMYTSGSTGRPKGVAIPHRGVTRLVCGARYAELGPGEVLLFLSSPSFDLATFEVWGALLNGGRLAVAPPAVPSLAELGEILAASGTTTLWLTAGLFHQVVDHRISALSGLSQLLAGGDALSPAHVRRVREALPACRLIDGYGPTENTTFTTCHEIAAPPEGAVPIGRPIAGTRVYVLDDAFGPQPAGVAGELLTGGAGLARGYLDRPDATAAAFVPDPFGGEPGARLYRTGDLARWNPGGFLEFLGRRDRQVKVRGFRIEPGEIEAVLASHPEVADAALLVSGEDRRLVAFVVARREPPPGAEEVRAFLQAKLPAYMVPSDVLFLPTMPLTSRGKVDRSRLAVPRELGARAAFVAPRSDLEAGLARIWEEVLAVAPIGVHDDFFALGGHSLKGMRVLAQVAETFGAELPVRSLFAAPTVAGQALAVVRRLAAGVAGEDLAAALAEVREGR